MDRARRSSWSTWNPSRRGSITSSTTLGSELVDEREPADAILGFRNLVSATVELELVQQPSVQLVVDQGRPHVIVRSGRSDDALLTSRRRT